MTRPMSRRESVKLTGAAALGAGLVGPERRQRASVRSAEAARVAPAAEELRGIFVILSTPYTESSALDYEDLAFHVEWLQRAGVHGLVWPQNSSDYPQLTRDEIRRGFEVLVEANRSSSRRNRTCRASRSTPTSSSSSCASIRTSDS